MELKNPVIAYGNELDIFLSLFVQISYHNSMILGFLGSLGLFKMFYSLAYKMKNCFMTQIVTNLVAHIRPCFPSTIPPFTRNLQNIEEE